MKIQAHRGVGTEFPENTLPAFEAAAIQGYDYIELDPRFTKDDYLAVLHDDTLNRTCRYPNGNEIEKSLPLSDITYKEALKYDAGISKSYKFKGVKIPLLSEILDMAQKYGLTVKLDNKIQDFSTKQTEILYNIVEKSGAKVAFTSSNMDYIKKTVARFPNAEIHYDGYVNEDNLKTVKDIMINNKLTVWLCLKSPLTSWVTVPTADKQLCETVKKYADLGLWLLYDDTMLTQAQNFGADIIETTGSLKPKRKNFGIINCHTHTKFSHDSVCEPKDSFNFAKENNLAGFAITDHCDIESYEHYDIKTPICNSVKTAQNLGDFVFSGIEIGESLWNNDVANDIISSENYDIVLGSVHAARYSTYTKPFAGMDFSNFTENQIFEYMHTYFSDMLEMIEKCDFDVLSHLTNPLKYITGKYGIKVDLNKHSIIIEKILKNIIDKGIALEINTACLDSSYDAFMPEKAIIAKFKELGGYLITLGSDAHTSDRIAHGFKKAVFVLKELGFKNLYYYKNRIPMQYSLEEF